MNPLFRLLAAALITYMGAKQTIDQVRHVMDIPPPKKNNDWPRNFLR